MDQTIVLEDCEDCGNRRHFRRGKFHDRCHCITKALRMQKVKKYHGYKEGMVIEKREALLGDNLTESKMLVGEIDVHAPYVSGVYYYSPTTFAIRTLYAYNIHEAYIGDIGLKTFNVPDLLIVLLGFNDLTTRNLGEVILQVYQSREMKGKATWFISKDLKLSSLKELYGSNLMHLVEGLKTHNFGSAK